jgi:MoaA/NifB/PqqE/SkfB family radical SAM enzyme
MGFLETTLATKGMNTAVALKILGRHVYAFGRHLTAKKMANFAKAEWNRFRKKEAVSSYPYILKIEPSNICNMRCAYCYDNRRQPREGERPYGRMSLQQFKQIIDEMGEYLFKINLYGFGEPWLFPETLEMIRYAADRNIGVGVSSNMNFDDPGLPKRIVDSGLEVLIFSCHGLSRETYTKFMAGGDPDVALRNLGAVIREREKAGRKTPFVDWQYCVTGFNEHEREAAMQKAKELRVDQIRFIKPFFPDDASDEWFSSMFPKHTYKHMHEKSPGCNWIYRSAYINFDGGVIACCRDVRLIGSDFGNVFSEGFKSIWNNEKYRASRAIIAGRKDIVCNTICSRCPIVQVGRKT